MVPLQAFLYEDVIDSMKISRGKNCVEKFVEHINSFMTEAVII